MTRVHNYNESLALAQTDADSPFWWRAYDVLYPGQVQSLEYVTDPELQQRGADRIVHLKDGRSTYFEEKSRSRWYGDILLEYWSNRENGTLGWAVKSDPLAHYLLYAIPSANIFLLRPLRGLATGSPATAIRVDQPRLHQGPEQQGWVQVHDLEPCRPTGGAAQNDRHHIAGGPVGKRGVPPAGVATRRAGSACGWGGGRAATDAAARIAKGILPTNWTTLSRSGAGSVSGTAVIVRAVRSISPYCTPQRFPCADAQRGLFFYVLGEMRRRVALPCTPANSRPQEVKDHVQSPQADEAERPHQTCQV